LQLSPAAKHALWLFSPRSRWESRVLLLFSSKNKVVFQSPLAEGFFLYE